MEGSVEVTNIISDSPLLPLQVRALQVMIAVKRLLGDGQTPRTSDSTQSAENIRMAGFMAALVVELIAYAKDYPDSAHQAEAQARMRHPLYFEPSLSMRPRVSKDELIASTNLMAEGMLTRAEHLLPSSVLEARPALHFDFNAAYDPAESQRGFAQMFECLRAPRPHSPQMLIILTDGEK